MHASEAFFHRALVPMYISTRAGLFLQVNEAFGNLLGWEPDEMRGTEVESTLAMPLERRRFRFEMDTRGRVSQFKLKLRTRTMEVVSAVVDAVAVDDLPGGMQGYIGLVTPMRISLPALTGLDHEMKRLALAVSGANDGLWDWDLTKGDAFFNQRWKGVLGYAPAEIGPRIHEWFDRLHVQDQAPVKQALAGVIKGSAGSFALHCRMRHKDGRYIWVLAKGVGAYNEAGRCQRLAGSMSDVTSHIRLVEKERQQSQRLEELNAGLSQDRALLSQYFSGDMLSAIFQEGKARIRESVGPAAVLQIHLDDFDELWTHLDPSTYGTLLNDILTDIMDLVYGCQGSVNKIMGDTLLTTFGCPLPESDDLSRAHRAASEILKYLKTFNDVRPEGLEQPLTVSMGLTFGDVFSGTLGSVHRLEYAVIGNPVKRAAALQRLASEQSRSLLIDQDGLLSDGTAYKPLPGFEGIWTSG